jgi:hypothetical protein
MQVAKAWQAPPRGRGVAVAREAPVSAVQASAWRRSSGWPEREESLLPQAVQLAPEGLADVA